MTRRKGTLTDKYLQFFTASEATAGANTLQSWDYDTGMSPRGGWIWEIYMVEMKIQPDPAFCAAAAINAQAWALSFVANETNLPQISDYGCLWRRDLRRLGDGVSNSQYFYEPHESVFYLERPILYAKKNLYSYYIQDIATAALDLSFRIGYLTKPTTGALLWEVVEQYMSSAT